NNLLTSILGYSSLGMLGLKADDPLHPILADVRKAAESAAHLTRQLLAFARKQVVEPRVLDLREVVADLHRLLGRVIGEDVELCAAPGEGPAAVRVDPGQVEQILVNLAVNARDAMPGGGRLTISTGQEVLEDARALALGVPAGRYVRLTVADTGSGMGDEVKAHLFEPFFTTKPRGRGTGLGLASVYGAVRQAGGAIDVDTAAGRGTAFHIFLPAQDGPAAPLRRGPDEPELPAGHEAVLLVEDDAVVREAGRRMLERLGYRVWSASSGEEALRLVVSGTCQAELLFSDVVMPGLNGVELTQQLRAMIPGLKVVLTSGYAEEAVERLGERAPGALFLPKPYTAGSLAGKLREALDGPPRRR
ncbi:MAG TPA: response regulator, partial [Myxococcota bacterium]|nr:response regulator [Myxococcota bacterium]